MIGHELHQSDRPPWLVIDGRNDLTRILRVMCGPSCLTRCIEYMVDGAGQCQTTLVRGMAEDNSPACRITESMLQDFLGKHLGLPGIVIGSPRNRLVRDHFCGWDNGSGRIQEGDPAERN